MFFFWFIPALIVFVITLWILYYAVMKSPESPAGEPEATPPPPRPREPERRPPLRSPTPREAHEAARIAPRW